jgi:hypothetical protein
MSSVLCWFRDLLLLAEVQDVFEPQFIRVVLNEVSECEPNLQAEDRARAERLRADRA